MRAQILYLPEGIEMDLGEPDLGHPEGLEIIQRHYRQSEKSGSRFSRRNPAFACLTHLGGTNPGLFIKKIRDEWWAVHYEAGICGSHRLPAPMSDEHKYQTEYWVRAAEDAGWRAEREHTLPTRTRPDALIHGPVLTGVEVQRSAMTVAAAVARTRKAFRAGVTDVWFTSRKPEPLWAWRVPTVAENDLSWQLLPPRRAATATGLRIIRPARCAVENFDRCPYTRRHCGRRHPLPEAWIGLTVDDVAARFPAGQIKLLRFHRNSRRDDVFLVPPESLALYEELTGNSGQFAADPVTDDRSLRKPAGTVTCRNNQIIMEGQRPAEDAASVQVNTRWSRACVKCGEAPPGSGGILCPQCKTAIEAGALWHAVAPPGSTVRASSHPPR